MAKYWNYVLLLSIIACGAARTKVGLFLEDGKEFEYNFNSRVLLDDLEQAGDIGYGVTGSVLVSPIWRNPANQSERLLQVQIVSLKLKTKFRVFSTHKSRIENSINEPFVIYLKNNIVRRIYVDMREDEFLVNIKKSVSSIFQFQPNKGLVFENDVSGNCEVLYSFTDSKTIKKRKQNCSHDYLEARRHSEKMLGVDVSSKHDILYELDDTSHRLTKVTSYENHSFQLIMDNRIGATVTAVLDLNINAVRSQTVSQLKSQFYQEAIKEMEGRFKNLVKQENLQLKVSEKNHQKTQLQKLIKANREYLEETNLGTLKSASSFLQLLKTLRSSDEDLISKIIQNSKNKHILNQLMDLLGATQTISSHNAVVKLFNFNDEKNLNYLERYLWALSTGCCPQEEIIKDLIERWKNKPQNEKLQETLLLTLASLTNRLIKTRGDNKLTKKVLSILSNGLSNCENDRCITMHLSAFGTVIHQDNRTILVKYALTGSRLVSTAALKALYSLTPVCWDNEVLKAADRIYYQRNKQYDSSARTIAADIILEGKYGDEESLTNLLLSLASSDPAYEIKCYLLHRVRQMASGNKTFSNQVNAILKSKGLNNYHILAPNGLSNALTTTFFEYNGINATLHSVNEVSKGTLKRSVISVSLEKDGDTFKIFSLGTFSSGLSSFLFSDESYYEDLDEPEDTKAGMVINLFGAQIRPFVFFSGNAELMGHVWSGTASTKTPVHQAIILLQDHTQLLPLGNGDVFRFNLHGASSFELAGNVEFSIWNRNAVSLLQTNAATFVRGSADISNLYVENEVEFSIGSEVTLDLNSNLEFSNEILLCFRLSQPDFNIKYEVSKALKILENGNKPVRRKNKIIPVVGRTYTFGQKNNEMCRSIFNR